MARRWVLGFPILLMLLAAVPWVPAASGAPSSWTFMVYLDADNNLEDVGVDDFLEMASVGSTAKVNIVVQFDRSTLSNPAAGGDTRFGDWTTAKRFLVQKDMSPTPNNALTDLDEVNMADPDTLADFVIWAMTDYPADHYFLDLWDHGIGWKGVIQDLGFMKTGELAQALEVIYNTVGKIDIIGNDACRMTVEIDYQLRRYADYFVGSEKDEPLAGWPYDDLMAALVANPAMSPSELGRTLVDAYVESYRENSLYSVALSLIESAALEAVAEATSRFVEELNSSLPYFKKEVLAARNATERYEMGEEFDLYDFAREVYNGVPSRRLKDAASSLMSQILRAVTYEAHWDNPSPINGIPAKDAHGLSVWFPTSTSNDDYNDLNWSEDTGWNDFIQNYTKGTITDLPITLTILPTDSRGSGAFDGVDVQVGGVPGGTFTVDVYQGPLLFASEGASMGSVIHIDLPQGIVVDLSIYTWDSAGLLVNYTEIGNVHQVPFVFSGRVLNQLGDAIPGVEITARNVRTNATYAATSGTAGGYYIAVPAGQYAAGDNVTLQAIFEGETRTVSITIPEGATSLEVDLIFETLGKGTPDDGMKVWLAAILVLEAVLIGIALVPLTKGRRPF